VSALSSLTADGEVVIDMDEIVESADSQPTPDFYSACFPSAEVGHSGGLS
jgi:hypothetical protein